MLIHHCAVVVSRVSQQKTLLKTFRSETRALAQSVRTTLESLISKRVSPPVFGFVFVGKNRTPAATSNSHAWLMMRIYAMVFDLHVPQKPLIFAPKRKGLPAICEFKAHALVPE